MTRLSGLPSALWYMVLSLMPMLTVVSCGGMFLRWIILDWEMGEGWTRMNAQKIDGAC